MNIGELLYNKITTELRAKNISISKLGRELELDKQVVSYRILAIKDRQKIDLKFLSDIEKVIGKKLISITN